MSISVGNQHYLAFLRDIYEVSNACSTTTYIWGGFTIDILEGRFLRDHGDLDGFTLNLLDVLQDMTELYEARGYAATFRTDSDIRWSSYLPPVCGRQPACLEPSDGLLGTSPGGRSQGCELDGAGGPMGSRDTI